MLPVRSGKVVAACTWAVVSCGVAQAAPRDVQIRSIDLGAGIIELYNFGVQNQLLNGWQFCTHDDNQIRIYTGISAMNGMTIEAGTSLFVHFNNDAPPGNSDHVNRSQLGLFAMPLDAGPYSMQIYSFGDFDNGNNIADHLQWSVGGVDNLSADERSEEADRKSVV